MIVHGCVVLYLRWLPRGGAFLPTALECFCMLFACASEHYCHPTVERRRCQQEQQQQRERWFLSLFTSLCEHRNVQAVGHLQKQLFGYFPDDMLTQLSQEILPRHNQTCPLHFSSAADIITAGCLLHKSETPCMAFNLYFKQLL